MTTSLFQSKPAPLAIVTLTSLLACGGRSAGLDDIELAVGGSDGAATTTTGGAGAFGVGGSQASGGFATQAGGGFATQTTSGGNTSTSSDAGPCVVHDLNLFSADTCGELTRLVVRDPKVVGPSTSGRIMPGDTLSLSVTLTDVSGLGYNMYPGVVFESNLAGVVIDQGGGGFFLYALLACQSVAANTTVHIPANLAPGTVVIVTARAASLNVGCPNSPAIVIPIAVG